MKSEAKAKAITLRGEGHSVKDIAEMVGAAKSSVSVWVRDVELTDAQKEALIARNPAMNGQMAGAKARKEKAREERIFWQNEGRKMAKEGSVDFIAGCMLYWAEGRKCKNRLGFANSDPDMMRVYMKWLRDHFDVKDENFSMSAQVYLNAGITFEDVVDYWLGVTGLSHESLRKSRVDIPPTSSGGQKKGRLPYGTCRVVVCDTTIVQRVFGAIKEYSGCEDEEKWIS